MNRLIKTIGFISLASILFSCEKEKDENTVRTEIVPLKIGNRWIRKQSNFDTNGQVVSISYDSVLVRNDTLIGGEKWFRVTTNQVSDYLTNRSDGYYRLYNGVPELVCKYPAKVNDYFVTNDGDTVKVLSINANVIGITGNFNCYHYYLNSNGLLRFDYWVSPGVGFVKSEGYYMGELFFRDELLQYTLM